MAGKDYLLEIQKFTTSQYWNSGVRITAGVMIPTLVMIQQGWLSIGIPFLFGALFVSLTDTPGPIHHRRNGMFAALALNTFTVLVVSLTRQYDLLLAAQVLIFSFFFSMMGIYGARAGAVGILAIVMMLIHMSPLHREQSLLVNTVLTALGGLWYTVLSLTLYRLQPYRLVEQALGENLMVIASYLRARGAFYKADVDVEATFHRVMKEQVDVLNGQIQMRELLFKTRQFVSDASPKSRSVMMIFLESLDLFEETMYSYQDYEVLRKHISPEFLDKFYLVILQVVAELELIGLSVQSGLAVKKTPRLQEALELLEGSLNEYQAKSEAENESLLALKQTLKNVMGIVDRLGKIVLYTRMEAYDKNRVVNEKDNAPGTQPLTFSLFTENLSLRSTNFRFAVRVCLSMFVGFVVSSLFELSHAYWVLLTIITILKPVYNLTRARNIQRVAGTLAGVVAGSGILYLLSNNTALLVIMTVCMLLAYSLLRVNYFGFVTFLTVYIIITFHFLNPFEFRSLIGERLIDTFIGSVIAGLAARFVFPFWHHHSVRLSMQKSLLANTTYFLSAWNALREPRLAKQYNAARKEAIVTLTNLSDHFQQMLAEPGEASTRASVHQFVIASHSLTSRISALAEKDIQPTDQTFQWMEQITSTLQVAETFLVSRPDPGPPSIETRILPALPTLHPLSIVSSLARDIKGIATTMGSN
jgi:uncharacterized membrane protein YccC